MAFLTHQHGELVYHTSDILENGAIRHGFSTRLGGVSQGYRASLNFRGSGPDPDSRELMEAVLSLPANQRAAVHLHYYEGYTCAEIASILGQRPGTVRSHLSRARDSLRKYLTDEEDLA